MDSQADQPFGGGTEPAGGEAQPHGGAQPPGAGGGQQYGGGQEPYPGAQQPYPGAQQPYPGAQQPYPGAQQPYPGQQYPGQQPYPGAPQPYPGQPYGPGQPPYSAGRPKVRPGRVWYLAALVVFLGGVAWLIVGLVSLSNQINGFPRVPLPGGGAVTLSHGGGYVVYYEGPGAASGRIPSFNVRIVPAAPPAAVASLKSYSGGSVNYTFGSRQGRAVLSLQVTHPGRFLIEPVGAPSGADLAFGSSITGSIVGIVLPAIGLMLLGVAVFVILLIIRIVRVRRARQAGMQPAWQ